jgi:demethylmenaquinone methyltransferase/2-methoxy-6-polyprenyl-1,4-benzoquinol methylase
LADISKDPRRIAGMFDAIAERYDLLNHLLSAGIDRRWRRQAIRSLALRGGERVLDLCTGTADLAMAARRAVPSAARVIGMDFAAAMLRVGRDKIRQSGEGDHITLVRADATGIPLASESVDAITIAFGIRNVSDPSAACAEMHRVLRRGGRFAILEFAVPVQPVVRVVYLWYFNHLLPRIGRAISRHDAAYGYLPASVGAFASPGEFHGVLRRAGFADVTATRLTFGIVCLYAGRKS